MNLRFIDKLKHEVGFYCPLICAKKLLAHEYARSQGTILFFEI